MRRDLESGVYDPSRDPPFLHLHALSGPEVVEDDRDSDYFDDETGSDSRSDSGCYSWEEEDGDGRELEWEWEDGYGDGEGISPFDMPRPKQIPKYARLITPLQRHAYHSRVSDVLNHGHGYGHEPLKSATAAKTVEEDEDLRFAYYQVDYHIHLHDRARCSMLTLCRDIEDVRQLRGWEFEMRQLDEAEAVAVHDSGLPTTAAVDDELFMVHQTALWKRRWRLRQRRVNEVRRKWAQIMAERRRQREQLLLERRKIRAKVKLYTWKEGDKVLLRELSL